MAKVTITIEDKVNDKGQATCAVNFDMDHQGAPLDAPATDAAIVAIAFQRLWNHRVFVGLTQLLCDDILAPRMARAPRPVGAKPKAPAVPDKADATDVEATEVVDNSPPAVASAEPKEEAPAV